MDVVGAGRSRGLEEWVAETSSTSLLVLDQGTVVHEWYADGLGADTRFLGASMTKSVLAHLVGRAVRDGALALTDAVTGHVPELAGTGYDGTTVVDLLTMTTGVDWVEDHRDPDSLASRLRGLLRDRVRLAGPAARRASRRAAGHPVRLLHGRLAGAGLGARAGHRPLLRRRRRAAVGGTRLHP